MASRLVVRRYSVRSLWPAGSFQRLERHHYIGPLRVWVTVVDSEDVPPWAAIQLGALGYTDWVSRFSEHIK